MTLWQRMGVIDSMEYFGASLSLLAVSLTLFHFDSFPSQKLKQFNFFFALRFASKLNVPSHTLSKTWIVAAAMKYLKCPF